MSPGASSYVTSESDADFAKDRHALLFPPSAWRPSAGPNSGGASIKLTPMTVRATTDGGNEMTVADSPLTCVWNLHEL